MANIFRIERAEAQGLPLFNNDQLVGHYSNYLKALNAAKELGATKVDVYAHNQIDVDGETRYMAKYVDGSWVR